MSFYKALIQCNGKFLTLHALLSSKGACVIACLLFSFTQTLSSDVASVITHVTTRHSAIHYSDTDYTDRHCHNFICRQDLSLSKACYMFRLFQKTVFRQRHNSSREKQSIIVTDVPSVCSFVQRVRHCELSTNSG
jgi:hypothetical protein